MRTIRLPRLLAVLGVLVLTSLARAGDDKDSWYVLEMLGQRAGWMHNTTSTAGDKITSTTNMQISVGRGTMPIKVSMESTFVETADGKPVSMSCVKNLAAKPITEKYAFKEDGSITLTTDQPGSTRTTDLAKPDGVWLTPAAADKYVTERFKAGAKEVKVRTIDPTEGARPVSVTRTGFEKTTLTIDGRSVDATKVNVETLIPQGDKPPMVVRSTEYVDGEGELLQSDLSMGGLAVRTIATTRAKALENVPAPEIMVSTFIKPDRPIHDPRNVKKLVLLGSVPEGEFPELPTTGAQGVEPVAKTSARLTITAQSRLAAPQEDAKNPAYLKATAMANIEDPKVQELAREAVKGIKDDPAAKAEACRRFVFRYIKKKDLDVGFASASEVARDKEGDCTEHGVLLTALLRANGIPARSAMGLIYVDEFAGAEGVFGYHMWAQALLNIDGKPHWVDLDGTLPGSSAFDATHITLSTTDLADGESISGLAAIAPLMGRLKIKVESVGK